MPLSKGHNRQERSRTSHRHTSGLSYLDDWHKQKEATDDAYAGPLAWTSSRARLRVPYGFRSLLPLGSNQLPFSPDLGKRARIERALFGVSGVEPDVHTLATSPNLS